MLVQNIKNKQQYLRLKKIFFFINTTYWDNLNTNICNNIYWASKIISNVPKWNALSEHGQPINWQKISHHLKSSFFFNFVMINNNLSSQFEL